MVEMVEMLRSYFWEDIFDGEIPETTKRQSFLAHQQSRLPILVCR